MSRTMLLAVLALGLSTAARAQGVRPPLKPAQPPPTPEHPTFAVAAAEHGMFVTVGGTFLLNGTGFTSAIRPLSFGERASIETRYAQAVMPGFDVAAGKRIWRQLVVGGDFERVSKGADGDITAQVPHPFFFNRLRAVSGQASGIHRTENALHMQAAWSVPIRHNIDLGVGGGPSWIAVAQDLVSDVAVVQAYPFDTASFGSAVTERHTEGALGVNAGMTLDYRFGRRTSIALGARFSHAHVAFNAADGSSVGVDAGGAHLGAGIRFRF